MLIFVINESGWNNFKLVEIKRETENNFPISKLRVCRDLKTDSYPLYLQLACLI